MTECIFFDFDGVLTTDESGNYTTFSWLAKETGIPFETLSPSWRSVASDAYSGKRDIIQIWHDFCGTLGQEIDLQLLFRAFESTPKNEAMFTLCTKLRSHYRLGIITVNTAERIHYLDGAWGLHTLFDPIIVSANVGAFKNNPHIFNESLRQAHVDASQAVFIDNHKDNLVVAKELGMQTYFFETEKNDIAALTAWLHTVGVVV